MNADDDDAHRDENVSSISDELIDALGRFRFIDALGRYMNADDDDSHRAEDGSNISDEISGADVVWDLAGAFHALYLKQLCFNDLSECIKDGDKVYVQWLGPTDGFRTVDYFHGTRNFAPFRPMARMDWDELDVSVEEMFSAEPQGYLDRAVTKVKRCWRVGRRARFWAIACVLLKHKTPQTLQICILSYYAKLLTSPIQSVVN